MIRRAGLVLIFLCGLAALQGLLAATLRAQSRPFEVGIARSNMIWETGPKQVVVFAGDSRDRRRLVSRRLRLSGGSDRGFCRGRAPGRAGRFLKMLVVIMQSADDYDNAAADNAGPTFKSCAGWPDGSLKPSRINLGNLLRRLRGLLVNLESRAPGGGRVRDRQRSRLGLLQRRCAVRLRCRPR